MNNEEATQRVQEAITDIDAFLISVRQLPKGDPIAVPLSIVRHLPLVASFLMSKPYTTVDYEEGEQFGFSMYNRVDIMAAFKKHAMAVLTNVCQDCGESMDTHTRNHHDLDCHNEPPDRVN